MTSNRLPVLAAEITEAHALCRRAVGEVVRHAIEAGRRLLEAKELVPHGQWEAWLATNVPGVSVRTAQRYMRAARHAGKSDTVSFSSLRALVRPKQRKEPEAPSRPCGHPFGHIHWYHHQEGSTGHCQRCGGAIFLPAKEVWRCLLIGHACDLDPDDFIGTTFARFRAEGIHPDDTEAEFLAAAADRICDAGNGLLDNLCGTVLNLRRVRKKLGPQLFRSWLVHEFGEQALSLAEAP